MSKRLNTIIDAFRALEEAFGGKFCIHSPGGGALFKSHIAPSFHDNTFCCQVKLCGMANLRFCTDFDMKYVSTECMRKKSPLFKICPFGVFEIVVPVFSGGNLFCTVFYGPFRLKQHSNTESVITSTVYVKSNEEMDKSRYSLPEIDMDTARRISQIISGLAENINSLSSSMEGEMNRKIRISRFITVNFRNKSIGIENLASYLHLSISRTSHILKSEFDTTFPKLLNQYRFESAEKLLCGTVLNTGTVSELSGFSSSQYFYRIFKKRYGMTPSEFREKNKNSFQEYV